MDDSKLAPSLIAAYRETHYHVTGTAPLTLRFGVRCAELAEAHQREGVASSTFVTACNPHSRALTEQENRERMGSLRDELRSQGRAFSEGIGLHPSNEWPGEPSLLVFGLARDESCALGRRLEQNAIIFCGEDAVAELVLLR